MKIHNGLNHEEDRLNWEFDEAQKLIWHDDFMREQEICARWGLQYTLHAYKNPGDEPRYRISAFWGPHELWLHNNTQEQKRREEKFNEWCREYITTISFTDVKGK